MVAVAAIAGAAGISGYLNAKFHIGKDVKGLYAARRAQVRLENLSPSYEMRQSLPPDTDTSDREAEQGQPIRHVPLEC